VFWGARIRRMYLAAAWGVLWPRRRPVTSKAAPAIKHLPGQTTSPADDPSARLLAQQASCRTAVCKSVVIGLKLSETDARTRFVPSSSRRGLRVYTPDESQVGSWIDMPRRSRLR